MSTIVLAMILQIRGGYVTSPFPINSSRVLVAKQNLLIWYLTFFSS